MAKLAKYEGVQWSSYIRKIRGLWGVLIAEENQLLPKARETLVELRRAFLWISSTLPAEHSLGERIEHRSHANGGLLTLPTVKWVGKPQSLNGRA